VPDIKVPVPKGNLNKEETESQGSKLVDSIPESLKPHFFAKESVPNFLNDFDVLGFDVDHCLATFNDLKMNKLMIKSHLKALRKMGYPVDILEFEYENFMHVCATGVVWDIANGTVI
jgi:hypothetical protein